MSERSRTPYTLLVEDSPTDQFLTIQAFEREGMREGLSVVDNGVDALAFLRRQGEYADSPRPDIILLDLNLPRMNGREVLVEIKGDPDLRCIPVIVLSSSSADEDLAFAYAHHANSYICKPVSFQDFTAVVRALGNFWFDLSTLVSPEAVARSNFSSQAVRGASADSSSDNDPIRVLLVEDSPTDALLAREGLRRSKTHTFQVTCAETLAQAILLLAQNSFQVILTDLGLPDSWGMETYRSLRAECPLLPIIVLTGLDDEATGVAALHEGAHDFLAKGQWDGRALARSIRYALEKARLEQQLRLAQ